MSTFVSLLEVLESRGSPLDDDEVWAILLTAAETLTSISNKGTDMQTLEIYMHVESIIKCIKMLLTED